MATTKRHVGTGTQPVMPHLIDATLREGCQSLDRQIGVAETLAIGRALASIGIDTIECGHPLASAVERDRVHALASEIQGVPVLSHARARREDIKAVADCGASWVGTFIGVNDVSLRSRLNRTLEQAFSLAAEAISYAKDLDLKVRFTVEDSSRTELSRLVETYGIALGAGADRICFADTVGCANPQSVREVISHIAQNFPNTPIEVHLHDDRGLAMANALAALDAGASWVSTSVNGIGERCGIVDTLALLMNLDYESRRPLPRGCSLSEISRTVATITGLAPDGWRPVVGSRAFQHGAKLHRNAISKERHSYEWIDSDLVHGRVEGLAAV